MRPGAHLALYVGGTRKLSGHIVATARIGAVAPASRQISHIDPLKYLQLEPAAVVLTLTRATYLEQPIMFRDRLPSLSFCPKNMSKWGIVLHGGAKQLNEEDWDALFAP